MATTTKRTTTKPVSPQFKTQRAELRAANARGEKPAAALYKTMDREAKTAFLRSRAV